MRRGRENSFGIGSIFPFLADRVVGDDDSGDKGVDDDDERAL